MYQQEEKRRDQKISAEKSAGGFRCLGCKEWVVFSESIGTAHRNHCPSCFCSRHVDLKTSGDRASSCGGKMIPMGLTFKHEGVNKYGQKKPGELMIIHECISCGKISINRIAGDDDEEGLMKLFEEPKNLDSEKIEVLKKSGIRILTEVDRAGVMERLFGRRHR